MNNQYLDILLFGALAIFLAFRLRNVLGKRTGEERPPPEQFQRNARPRSPVGAQSGDAADRAPPYGGPMRPDGPGADPLRANPDNVIDLAATRLNATITAGLAEIQRADPSFDLNHFVRGARQAFELIIGAFAAGDTATLRLLLSDDVYDTFAEIIRQRIAARETAETRIVSVADPVVLEAGLNGRTATIVLRFVSQQITVIRAADQTKVEGDEQTAVEHVDDWSFARNTRSADPNWFLVATGTHDH